MHKTPSHVYRNEKNADKVIQMFGRKPSEQVRSKVQDDLAMQRGKAQVVELSETRKVTKEKVMEQLRARQQQQRQRGRGR